MTATHYSFKHEVGLRLVKLFNLFLIVLPFILAWRRYYSPRLSTPYYIKGDIVIVGLFVLLYYMFGKTYDAFLVSHNKLSETVVSQVLSAILSNGVLYIIFFLLIKKIPNPLPLLIVWICQICIAFLWTVAARAIYFAWFPAKRSIVIYDMRQGMESLVSEYGLTKKFNILRTASVDECLDDMSMIDDMEVVFLSGIHSHERNVILKYCLYHNKDVYMIPRVGDVIMSSARTMHMFHLPVMRVTRYNPHPLYLIGKRFFDIVISFVALIVLSPVFLITAIAIKATDKGPVFYKQERLTRNGKRFMIHKFRSMRVDAEKDGVARLSTGDNDDRITPVGRFIRKCRIDELPQLIDILAGNLSVVGPRPERPQIAEEYVKEMPEFQLRLQCKAGLTGFAQVYGKYNTTPYDKLQMDLMYIAHPSLIEDLRICFATVKILFMPESTEGIAEGQTTAMGDQKVG